MKAWRALSSFSSSSSSSRRPRRRAWWTSLSPLERVKQLLPPEEAAAVGRCAAATPSEQQREESATATAQVPLEAPTARPERFRVGELALAEVQRKYNRVLKLMCKLTKGSVLTGSFGCLPHNDIIGQLPGQMLRTTRQVRLLLRRPSLEEYVLLMPRGPTIAYPKDISAILMMMDVHPGDTILETGSGSGAMSLFLSRAVGPEGRVISYELRQDHHNLAKNNYRHWRAAWEIGHVDKWPDNVEFILKDISTAAVDMKSLTVDSIFLDMVNPQTALRVAHPSLKQGGVCAVYLANITQVVELLYLIRTWRLPFLCEKIIEVTHRNWLVLPAKMKNDTSVQMVETQEDVEEPQQEYEEIHTQDHIFLKESEHGETLSDDAEPYCLAPYVARPSYWEAYHSAFLTKLRKFGPLL